MPAMARVGPGQNRKPRIPSRCPMQVSRIQEPEPPLLLSRVCISRRLNQKPGELGLNPGTQTMHSDMGWGKHLPWWHQCSLKPVTFEYKLCDQNQKHTHTHTALWPWYFSLSDTFYRPSQENTCKEFCNIHIVPIVWTRQNLLHRCMMDGHLTGFSLLLLQVSLQCTLFPLET